MVGCAKRRGGLLRLHASPPHAESGAKTILAPLSASGRAVKGLCYRAEGELLQVEHRVVRAVGVLDVIVGKHVVEPVVAVDQVAKAVAPAGFQLKR